MKYFYKWQILLSKTYFYLYLQNCHFNDKHEIQAQHELFEKDLAFSWWCHVLFKRLDEVGL